MNGGRLTGCGRSRTHISWMYSTFIKLPTSRIRKYRSRDRLARWMKEVDVAYGNREMLRYRPFLDRCLDCLVDSTSTAPMAKSLSERLSNYFCSMTMVNRFTNYAKRRLRQGYARSLKYGNCIAIYATTEPRSVGAAAAHAVLAEGSFIAMGQRRGFSITIVFSAWDVSLTTYQRRYKAEFSEEEVPSWTRWFSLKQRFAVGLLRWISIERAVNTSVSPSLDVTDCCACRFLRISGSETFLMFTSHFDLVLHLSGVSTLIRWIKKLRLLPDAQAFFAFDATRQDACIPAE